ncbi:D-alanine--D-alanine ligase family protein [Corynebacterium epidermidicanis]|uniref:D-alanine--D-alanine ligase n=1 Tax=Corynebacterium epidermidicanis TaxID=1050174 RepID=A0A0G3GP97_9CORY|nr:D-alanine--D-alanine ligase family protein [Corynebacterium epidermidicanis]AKK02979.1 D-alanine--D-alanine ligase [Corynebacterium epidermidicanis]
MCLVTNNERITVAVVYGGRSSEHSVSCISAGAIMSHMDPSKYQVVPVGITEQGQWSAAEFDPERLRAHGRTLPTVTCTREIYLSTDPARRGELRYVDNGELYAKVDVVFPVLHGKFGEDGTIQGLFELSGVPYVGCGVFASAASMDKEYTKKLAAAEGLPVGREVVLHTQRELHDAERDALGLPVFVKPARGGSSIGISRVTDWADFPAAVELAFNEDNKVIVEAEIVGSEVECGVLQLPDGTLQASLPAQLAGTDASAEGFYGFETKYLDDVVTPQIPAPIGEDNIALVQSLAIQTFKAMNCEGLARVDFFVTAKGPVLNEINTLPGFTPISMYPQMFAATGIDYPTLLDTLVQRALVGQR